MSEEWRPIVGYEGYYEVSDMGNVRSIERRVNSGNGGRVVRARTMSAQPHKFGYRMTSLSRDHATCMRLTHRLVMAAFVGPLPNGQEVNHINGNKADNRLRNLEYVTRRQNLDHAMRTGLIDSAGEKNSQAKLTNEQARDIRQRYRFGGGPGYKALAEEYGVTWEAIRNLIKGRTWGAVS